MSMDNITGNEKDKETLNFAERSDEEEAGESYDCPGSEEEFV